MNGSHRTKQPESDKLLTSMVTLLWIASFILVLLGVAGTILPVLPGAPLVFGGLLLAAWIDGFQKVGAFTLVILAGLTAVSFIVDFLSSSLGAARVGASRAAVAGAVIGMIAGLFLGLPGLILGPFVGAVVGEYWSRRNVKQAAMAGIGTWIGIVLGGVGKLVLAFIMVGIFITAYLI